MISNIKKGQVIYYYGNIQESVEKGVVENAEIVEDTIGAATSNPKTIHLVKLIRWVNHVYEDGTCRDDYGSSAALLDRCFKTKEEAFEARRKEAEAYENTLREELTDLYSLLNFPLKHCLYGEYTDYIALKVYKDAIEELKNFKGVIPNK